MGHMVLNDEQRAAVEKYARVLSQDQIADLLGIARKTLYTIMKRDPDVAARYVRGKSSAIAAIGGSLIKTAMEGNVPAQIFYLRTQGGWREASDAGQEEAATLNINIMTAVPVGPIRVTRSDT